MSFYRFVLLVSLIIITITISFSLHLMVSKTDFDEFHGGYAVIETGVSVNEAEILSLLDSGRGYFTGEPVSETSQWVMLDVFDSIEAIPLNKYFSRVFSFDPRYDAYAEKLRDVFIKDDKRFIYLPLGAENWNQALLDRQFNELLGGIEFSVNYFGAGKPSRPVNYFYIAYAAAAFLFLIIYLFKRKTCRNIGITAALLPLFSSLSFFGASGIICAALLIAYFIFMKDPFFEIAAGQQKGQFFNNIILQFKFHWLSQSVFAACFFIVLYFSQIELPFFFIVFAAALAVFFIAGKILSLPLMKHRRFNPVLIIKLSFPELVFPVYLIPFAAAAAFVIFYAPYTPAGINFDASYKIDKKFDSLISEEDYLAHIRRQASFSVSQLSAAESSLLFPSFFFDTDNLPSIKTSTGLINTINSHDYPSFPLKHLMEFFMDEESPASAPEARRTLPRAADYISLSVLILFILPCLFIKKQKNISLKDDLNRKKRFHSKIRLKGINWNKKSLYNDKSQLLSASQLRIQKDA